MEMFNKHFWKILSVHIILGSDNFSTLKQLKKIKKFHLFLLSSTLKIKKSNVCTFAKMKYDQACSNNQKHGFKRTHVMNKLYEPDILEFQGKRHMPGSWALFLTNT